MATQKKPGVYRVKKGDLYSTIAKRFRITATALAKHNDRSVFVRPKPGEALEIPLRPEDKLLIETRSKVPKMKKLNQKLIKDRAFRKSFQRNPARVMEKMGVEIDEELLPDSFPVLQLMDDRRFQTIFKRGDTQEIETYLSEQYPALYERKLAGPAHVADAVEAVVVAIPAIAVADPVV